MTSSEKPPKSLLAKRIGLGLVFVFSAMLLAFIAGAWIYFTLFNPSHGFAGSGEVFASGAVAGLGGGAFAVFLAWPMPPGKMLMAALATFAIAVVVIVTFYFQLISGA